MQTTPAPVRSEPEAADPMSKLATYGCTACHSVDTKGVGPAFKDVAARYQGRGDAAQLLEQKVRNGGSGAWGDIPMPPNAVPDAELHAIVQWVLTSR
jgi:cytochrome c551/c552